MGSWNFKQLGASCNKQDEKFVSQLLECCGVNLEDCYGSEAGEVSLKYNPDMSGLFRGDKKKVVNIYHLANLLFKSVTVFYEEEEGNNTSDYYYRYEEIWNPRTKKISIGIKDYEYGTFTAFGKNPYEKFRKQIERKAKKEGIDIFWEEYQECDFFTGELYPMGDEFCDFCMEFIDEMGGIETLGTKEKTKKIPDKKITKTFISKILKNAKANQYDELVSLLESLINKM